MAALSPRCGTGARGAADRMPRVTKAGKPRKTNARPIACTVCGHPCPPGYAVIEYSEREQRWVGFC